MNKAEKEALRAIDFAMDDSNSDSDEDEDEDNVKAMSPDTHLQPGGLQGHGCLRQLRLSLQMVPFLCV